MQQITIGTGILQVFEKGQGKKRIKLRGIISTEHRDRQGEVILQRGLDFRPFLDYGWFNDNHSGNSNDVLGYPERVFKTTVKGPNGETVEATAVEGYLLPTTRGKELLELSKALQGDPRRSLGFSVEGQVAERDSDDNSIITKAIIKNVAITHVPVNPNTTLQALAKGMTAGSISALMPESLEGSLKYNPIIRASVIARNHPKESDMKHSTTDYLSMFKMMPEEERKAMMDAYASFNKGNESSDMDVMKEEQPSEMSELEKMQDAMDRELGLKKSEPELEPEANAPQEERPPQEDLEEDAEETGDEESTEALLNKGMSVIEQAVSTDLDIADLSQSLADDADIQSATEIDASGFLKSLVDGNSASLNEIAKSLGDFSQQQRATNLTILAMGKIVQSLQTQISDLSKSVSAPVRAKGALNAPQAQAMQKSFEGQTQGESLTKSQVLNNLQAKLVKSMDNPQLSSQITDAIIRYESTGSISDEMMALATKA